MPVIALIVMPMALISLLALPVGLEAFPLAVMGWGIEKVLTISQWVGGLDGAVAGIPALSDGALLLVTIGGLCALPVARAMATNRPRCHGNGRYSRFFATAGCIGGPVRRTDCRSWQGMAGLPFQAAARTASSAARWLAADGDRRTQQQAAEGTAFTCDELGCVAQVKSHRIALAQHPAALRDDCESGAVVIANFRTSRGCKTARLVIDRRDLWQNGAYTLRFDGDQITVRTVAQSRGQWPWVAHHHSSGKSRKTLSRARPARSQRLLRSEKPQ